MTFQPSTTTSFRKPTSAGPASGGNGSSAADINAFLGDMRRKSSFSLELYKPPVNRASRTDYGVASEPLDGVVWVLHSL